MRMQRFFLVMVVMVFLLVGCGQQAATPPAPTDVPTEEPTDVPVPTVALVPTEHLPLPTVALVPTEEPTGVPVPTVALVPTEHLPLPTVQALEAQGTPSVDYMMGILEQGTPMPLWYYQSMIHKTIMDWEAGLAAFDDYDFHLTAQVFQDTHRMITRHNPPEEFSAWHQEFVDYSGCLTGVYTAYAEELPKPEYEIDVDRLDEIVARHQECQDMIPDFDVVMDR